MSILLDENISRYRHYLMEIINLSICWFWIFGRLFRNSIYAPYHESAGLIVLYSIENYRYF